MFFANKKLDQKILLLENEINELKNSLLLKDETIVEMKKEYEQKIEKNSEVNEKQVELFKEIAAHSQEEGLVVFDENNKLFYTNKIANINIKDYSVILKAVLENSNRLVMEDCEANIEVKKHNKGTSKN